MGTRGTLLPSDWTSPAAVAETHVSVVTFIGDRAYKLLKPVDLGFLDHRGRLARRTACHREVALNRRMAPDVYLGVLDLADPDGDVVDHMVVMRRMPADRRLAALLDTGEAEDAVRAVARAVASFHATARRSPAIDAAGSRDALMALWEESLEQMTPFVGPVLPDDEFDLVAARARDYLAGREPLFAARTAAGLMRDGHGDLLSEDVFLLPDGPRILDCLAFNDRMRWGDVLLDVAFLGMDLEVRGHPALARRLLDAYRDFAGERHPGSLWHHLVAYRAHVRAKIACMRHAQGAPGAAADAARHHALAARHTARGAVRIVMVGGAPGTGKSTLAEALSERGEMALLRSDEIRKDLAGMAHDESGAAPLGEGLYRPDRVHAVYAEMIRRAARLAALGESVLLDASWSSAAERSLLRAAARAAGAAVAELHCEAPMEVAERRVVARERHGGSSSDAGLEVARRLREVFDPWPEAGTIMTGGTVGAAVASGCEALGIPG